MLLLLAEKVEKTPIGSFIKLDFHSPMENRATELLLECFGQCVFLQSITEHNSSPSVLIRSLKCIFEQVPGNKSLLRALLVGLSILAAREKATRPKRLEDSEVNED